VRYGDDMNTQHSCEGSQYSSGPQRLAGRFPPFRCRGCFSIVDRGHTQAPDQRLERAIRSPRLTPATATVPKPHQLNGVNSIAYGSGAYPSVWVESETPGSVRSAPIHPTVAHVKTAYRTICFAALSLRARGRIAVFKIPRHRTCSADAIRPSVLPTAFARGLRTGGKT
jgi:hypothetical protein